MSIAAAASSALHGFADFMVGPRGYGASDLGQREREERAGSGDGEQKGARAFLPIEGRCWPVLGRRRGQGGRAWPATLS